MSDNYTPADGTDDVLASFSAAGPTHEAFVKPEVVAPGGHMRGLMSQDARIAQEYPDFYEGGVISRCPAHRRRQLWSAALSRSCYRRNPG